MKFNKFKILLLAGILLPFAISCEDDSHLSDNPIVNENYLAFEPNRTVYIPDGETTDTEVKVFISKPMDSDVIIPLIVDVEPTAVDGDAASTLPVGNYTIPATVTIPSGQTEGVFVISGIQPVGADKTIIIGFEPVEGIDVSTTYVETTDSTGNPVFTPRTRELTLNITEICGANPFRIEIVTDQWGTEATWELYDGAFNLVASGGPYTDAADPGEYPQASTNLCLPDGNYTFYAYDAPYFDGWSSSDYGFGYYRLVKMDPYGEEVEEVAMNGTFGATDEVTFSLP